jgi:hypothetical protein
MNSSRVKKGMTHFGGDVRTVNMECRLTGFPVYFILSGILLFVKAYMPLKKEVSPRLI